MYLDNCFKFFFLLSALVFLLLFFIFLILGYSQSIKLLINLFHIDFNNDRILQAFTIKKFYIFQALCLLLSSLFFVAFWYSKQIYIRVSPFIKDLMYSSFRVLKTQMSSYTALILVIPFLASVYYAITVPVICDEAFTFLNFTSRGVISSLSFYPAPNNHILHSLLTNITYFFPFLSALVKLRLPAIFINFLTILASLHFIKKTFGIQMAIVVTAVVSCFFMSIYYSFIARGYGIIALIFILSLNFAFNIISRNHQTRDYAFFSFFSVLGFYTIPTYLYPFILLCCFVFIAGGLKIKKLVISSATILLTVAILYMPVIILSGLDSLFSNKFIAPMSRIEVLKVLPYYFTWALKTILGIPWLVILPILSVSLILIIIQTVNRRVNIWFSIIMLSGPFILLIIHSVIPPPRVFSFYGFIIALIIFMPYRNILQKVNPIVLFVLLILFQLIGTIQFQFSIIHFEDKSYQSEELVIKTIGNNNYVVNSGWFDTYLLFELKRRNIKNYQLKYYYPQKMSADSMQGYDYLIIDKSNDCSVIKKPKYQNAYYSVYD